MPEGLSRAKDPNGLDDIQEELDRTVWEKDWEPSEDDEKGDSSNGSAENLEEAA